MSKVLVVGNGFDLALGLRTKYSDFINARTNIQNDLWPFRDYPKGLYSEVSLYRHFFDFFQNNKDKNDNIRWIDLEFELLKYVRSKGCKKIDPELAREDEEDFNRLKMMLQEYISVVYKIDPQKPDENILKLLHAIKADGNFNIAYSFNYTDLCSELVKYGGFDRHSLPRITNVHRTVSTKNYFNIVLGINEDLTLPKEYRFLFKSSQTESTDLAYDIAKADEVIFYGLSFGEIDFPYFESFFAHISAQSILDNKKHITIFTFGESSVNSIKENINKMGVTIHRLKERSYFNIIDMEKLWQPGYHEDAFNKIINRLQPYSL